jgi:hypothetical protein
MCLPPREDVAYDSSKAPKRQHSSVATAPHRRPTMMPVRMVTGDNRSNNTNTNNTSNVTFQPSPQLQEVFLVSTALSSVGMEQRHELWYNREDIREFRRQAASLSQQLRDGSSVSEYTRGLELRTSLERQDRKQMVVKRILDAQDDDSTPEELAQIAQQHSAWSRKMALAQAHKDYYAAYHPILTSVLPEIPALLDCHKDVASKKRSLLGGSITQTGRRVRCRMY